MDVTKIADLNDFNDFDFLAEQEQFDNYGRADEYMLQESIDFFSTQNFSTQKIDRVNDYQKRETKAKRFVDPVKTSRFEKIMGLELCAMHNSREEAGAQYSTARMERQSPLYTPTELLAGMGVVLEDLPEMHTGAILLDEIVDMDCFYDQQTGVFSACYKD